MKILIALFILLIYSYIQAEDYYRKTISSISVKIAGTEVFLNDTSFTDEKAIKVYNRTLQHLNKYYTINEAKMAARIMQSRLEKEYNEKGQLIINMIIF